MTHEEMAGELRKAGWLVVEPAIRNAAVPGLERGQVWFAAGLKQRTILVLDQTGNWPWLTYANEQGKTRDIGQANFLSGARKTGARPVANLP